MQLVSFGILPSSDNHKPKKTQSKLDSKLDSPARTPYCPPETTSSSPLGEYQDQSNRPKRHWGRWRPGLSPPTPPSLLLPWRYRKQYEYKQENEQRCPRNNETWIEHHARAQRNVCDAFDADIRHLRQIAQLSFVSGSWHPVSNAMQVSHMLIKC